MDKDHVSAINSMMEILRQRLFISHDSTSQRNIVSEYTIRSNHDKLTNLFFISKNVLPNLLVLDDKDNILPIMPTKYVKQLLEYFLEKSTVDQRNKLEYIISQINSGQLYLIWIKIPKHNALQKNEIRNIMLNYSPKDKDKKDTRFRIKIQRQKYPLYYSLFTPNEFNFNQTKYEILDENNGQVFASYTQPENVEKIKTHNSYVFRLNSDSNSDFAILYSFKPSSAATFSTKLGVAILSGLFVITCLVNFTSDPQHELIQNRTQIALFIIGGALLLPQLTGNNSIRHTQIKLYLVPAILGCVLLLW